MLMDQTDETYCPDVQNQLPQEGFSRFSYFSEGDASSDDGFEQTDLNEYSVNGSDKCKKKRGRPFGSGVSHGQPNKKRKLLPLVPMEDLPSVICCNNLCLSSNFAACTEDLERVRNYYQALSKEEKKQWVLDYLSMHYQSAAESEKAILYTVGTVSVCKAAWCLALGIPQSTFYEIKDLFLSGYKIVPVKTSKTGYQSNETLTALSWLSRYADQYGDKLPNEYKISLPMCITKQYVYQKMKEELEDCGERQIISESHFYLKWRESLPHIVIPKVSRFTLCSKCLKFKQEISETIEKGKRDAVKQRMDKHLRKQHDERKKYYKHIMKAKMNPSIYFSMIMDGMDTNKTMLPHFIQKDKDTSNMWMLKVHLTGVIVHGLETYGFFDYCQFPHGSNLTISILLQVLYLNREALPPVLYLQLDNCGRENKNRFVLAFLCLLVEKKVFRKVKLSFLMVGHTHEDIDRSFSVFSRWLNKNEALTPSSLMKGYESTGGVAIELQSVYDVSSWIQTGKLANHSKPHTFRITCNSDNGKAVIHYKNWTSDKEWLECETPSPNTFLVQDLPTGDPSKVFPNYDKVDLAQLEKAINKCQRMKGKEGAMNEWKEFIQEKRASGEEHSMFMLQEIVQASQRRTTQMLNTEVEMSDSDEDKPIPKVVLSIPGRKKKDKKTT